MGVNKVEAGGTTIIDISDSTLTEETMLAGTVGYSASGERTTGNATPVLYTAQSLTNEEKAQARENIGAVSWENFFGFGKNKLILQDGEYSAAEGFTFTVKDGLVTINGTAPSALNIDVPVIESTIDYGTTHCLTMFKVSGVGMPNVTLSWITNGFTLRKTLINVTNNTLSRSAVITAKTVETDFLSLRFAIANGYTFTNRKLQFQLEVGTTSTEYSPPEPLMPESEADIARRNIRAASVFSTEATLPASGWTASGSRWTQTIPIAGILASDEPVVDVRLEGLTEAQEDAVLEDWASMVKIITGNGSMTAYASAAPVINIPIRIKEVR